MVAQLLPQLHPPMVSLGLVGELAAHAKHSVSNPPRKVS